MTKNRASTASVTELLDAYRDAAARHGEATEKGDHKVANKMAEIVATAYAELRRRDAREQLLPLLADEAPWVRLWVGSHALEFAPQEGEPVLTSLTAASKLLGMDAEMTLNEWRAGRLRFP